MNNNLLGGLPSLARTADSGKRPCYQDTSASVFLCLHRSSPPARPISPVAYGSVLPFACISTAACRLVMSRSKLILDDLLGTALPRNDPSFEEPPRGLTVVLDVCR